MRVAARGCDGRPVRHEPTHAPLTSRDDPIVRHGCVVEFLIVTGRLATAAANKLRGRDPEPTGSRRAGSVPIRQRTAAADLRYETREARTPGW